MLLLKIDPQSINQIKNFAMKKETEKLRPGKFVKPEKLLDKCFCESEELKTTSQILLFVNFWNLEPGGNFKF